MTLSGMTSFRFITHGRGMLWDRSVRFVCWVVLWGLLAVGVGGGTAVHAQSGGSGPWFMGEDGGLAASDASTTSLFTIPSQLTATQTGAPVTLRFFDVRAAVGGDLLQFNHYENTFGERSGTLTNAEEARVLDEWFGEEQRGLATGTEVVPFALTYQPPDGQWAVGFGLQARARTEATMNRGLLDLFVVGADSNRAVPLGGGQRTMSTVSLAGAVSYRFESIPLSIGAAPRVILGTQYADATLDSEVLIRDSTVTHQYAWSARAAGGVSRAVYDEVSAFRANPFGGVSGMGGSQIAGLGGALNLGATYALGPNLFVSLGLANLGLIRWSRDAQTISDDDTFRFDGVRLDIERLQNEFDGDVGAYVEHQADSLARAAYGDVEREREAFSTRLPSTLHLGGTWARDQFTLSGGATVGLSGTTGAVRAAPSARLGGEYRLGPIPIRAGVRVGGQQAVTLSGGVGVQTGGFRIDLGLSATPSTSTLGRGGHYAVGLSLASVRF